jgi:hypothetical protein
MSSRNRRSRWRRTSRFARFSVLLPSQDTTECTLHVLQKLTNNKILGGSGWLRRNSLVSSKHIGNHLNSIHCPTLTLPTPKNLDINCTDFSSDHSNTEPKGSVAASCLENTGYSIRQTDLTCTRQAIGSVAASQSFSNSTYTPSARRGCTRQRTTGNGSAKSKPSQCSRTLDTLDSERMLERRFLAESCSIFISITARWLRGEILTTTYGVPWGR